MTTSGTISQTVIDVATIIEHAFRRAGKSPADQTSDALIAAQECLYFYLCQLAAGGTNLWTIEKVILGTINGQTSYPVGTGTVDVKDALYRTVNLAPTGGGTSSAGGTGSNAFDQDLTTVCTQTSANGNISYGFDTGRAVANVGINTYGNQTYNLVWEYSDDDVTYTTALASGSASYTDGVWAYYDIITPVTASYFRVRETSNGILNVREVCFNTIATEILMARINFDQYTTLTNKNILSRNILQYWLDRQVDNPVIRLWPVSNYDFDQMVVWRRRYIQDVGRDMTNTIEVPQYWIEAIVTELGRRLLLELPQVDKDRYDILKKEADMATQVAIQEDRDKSPIQLAPNISCYTR